MNELNAPVTRRRLLDAGPHQALLDDYARYLAATGLSHVSVGFLLVGIALALREPQRRQSLSTGQPVRSWRVGVVRGCPHNRESSADRPRVDPPGASLFYSSHRSPSVVPRSL